jgi:hypothetical protein
MDLTPAPNVCGAALVSPAFDIDPRAVALLSLLAEAYSTSPAPALVHTVIRKATAVTRAAQICRPWN